jgi:tetratricopeptide (TPR) repeat protein
VSRKLVAIGTLCIAAGILLFLSVGFRGRVQAQNLLREAARDGGPLEQIFGQQAGQGYYDDALATAQLATSSLPHQRYELAGWVEELIQIRAENGDIRGAKEMIKQLNDSALDGRGPKVTREVAKIQVDRGDLNGALESCASPADTNAVMEEFGYLKITKGDLEGALKIAEEVNEDSAYQLFYALGRALRDRGEQNRLHELASHMNDKKRAAEFLEAAPFTLWPSGEIRTVQGSPCEIAAADASSGKFAEAWSLVHQSNCGYSYVAIKQYASDPVQAEQELRKSADQRDASFGIAEMAKLAAKKGDIPNALRLLETARQISGGHDFCLDCVREIAWAWTLEGKPDVVLGWARSTPVSHQRGFALLGIAQALGHARPQ